MFQQQYENLLRERLLEEQARIAERQQLRMQLEEERKRKRARQIEVCFIQFPMPDFSICSLSIHVGKN